MKRYGLWLLGALLAAASCPSLAQARWDCNGSLSPLEEAAFQEADANGDSVLSLAEFKDFTVILADLRKEEMFAKADGDRDSVLTTTELVTARKRHCRRRHLLNRPSRER